MTDYHIRYTERDPGWQRIGAYVLVACAFAVGTIGNRQFETLDPSKTWTIPVQNRGQCKPIDARGRAFLGAIETRDGNGFRCVYRQKVRV